MSTISGISASGIAQTNWQSIMQQQNTDFQDLGSALQSGNLAGAQSAFADLQQLQNSNSQNSVISSDFDALGKALKSGDVKAAQTAFQKLQLDMQAMQASHRHHHHHGQGNVQQTNSDTDDSSTDSTTTSNNINALA